MRVRGPAPDRGLEPARAARGRPERRVAGDADGASSGASRSRGSPPRCTSSWPHRGCGPRRRRRPAQGRGVLGRVRRRLRALRRRRALPRRPARRLTAGRRTRRSSRRAESAPARTSAACRFGDEGVRRRRRWPRRRGTGATSSARRRSRRGRRACGCSRRPAGGSARRPAPRPGAAAASSCRWRGSPRCRRCRPARSARRASPRGRRCRRTARRSSGPWSRVPSGNTAAGSPASSAACTAFIAVRALAEPRVTGMPPSAVNSLLPKELANSSSLAMNRIVRRVMNDDERRVEVRAVTRRHDERAAASAPAPRRGSGSGTAACSARTGARARTRRTSDRSFRHAECSHDLGDDVGHRPAGGVDDRRAVGGRERRCRPAGVGRVPAPPSTPAPRPSTPRGRPAPRPAGAAGPAPRRRR